MGNEQGESLGPAVGVRVAYWEMMVELRFETRENSW